MNNGDENLILQRVHTEGIIYGDDDGSSDDAIFAIQTSW